MGRCSNAHPAKSGLWKERGLSTQTGRSFCNCRFAGRSRFRYLVGSQEDLLIFEPVLIAPKPLGDQPCSNAEATYHPFRP
jgi:hypothetical protein